MWWKRGLPTRGSIVRTSARPKGGRRGRAERTRTVAVVIFASERTRNIPREPGRPEVMSAAENQIADRVARTASLIVERRCASVAVEQVYIGAGTVVIQRVDPEIPKIVKFGKQTAQV